MYVCIWYAHEFKSSQKSEPSDLLDLQASGKHSNMVLKTELISSGTVSTHSLQWGHLSRQVEIFKKGSIHPYYKIVYI